MHNETPHYRSEFFKSPHHVVFGVLTLGAGFAAASVLPLIVGATAYALGWVYLPDMHFFRNWVDRRHSHSARLAEAQTIAEFTRRRDALLQSLTRERRERYALLTGVCRDIERGSADNPLSSSDAATDPRLRKIDELMWTYLRLLGIEQSLERFLATEKGEDLPGMIRDAEAEIASLKEQEEALKNQGATSALEIKQRYLGSRLERLEVLKKRLERISQGEANLALVVAEQDRLDQQIKLIRADAIATKNADAFSARIDATVQHLDQTNKWLAELDEFKDLVADMPATQTRVGYSAAEHPFPTAAPSGSRLPPVIPSTQPRRGQFRVRQRQ